MTSKKNMIKKYYFSSVASILCIVIIVLTFIFDNELKKAIIGGMDLAALRIIPTLFPFMIISDYWISNVKINENGIVGVLFEKILKINKSMISAFLTGVFAGFPLGVKSAVDVYSCGAVTRDELERIAPIINLPSLAFVISGVGLGLYNDIKIGFLFYFSVLVASLIVGFVQGRNKEYSHFTSIISRQSFNLTDSIKKAGLSSITISSYIIFFSGVIGLTSAILNKSTLLAFVASFLEVGNATVIISEADLFYKNLSLILTAFALGFSGFSVHLQAFSFLPKEISKYRYIKTKLIIGLLSSILMTIATFILKI